MNVLRRLSPRLFLGGCLVAALAAGSAIGNAQDKVYEGFRPAASNSKAAPAPVKKKKPTSGEVFDDPHDKTPRIRYESKPTGDVHLAAPRNAVSGRSAVRQASVGFVPKHERVTGAQFLSEEPMVENLPAPLGPERTGVPRGMGPPGMRATDGPTPALPGGRRSVIVGEGPTLMGSPMHEHSGEMPLGGDPFSQEQGGCSSCGGGECASCGHTGGGVVDCFPCLNPRDLDVYSGVFGFTNPTNRGGAGSFGYTLGFNKGRTLPCFPCSNLGMQIGAAGNFSNFDGATFSNGAALANTPDSRNQLFLTGGLFRRVDWGLQGGVVFDYLHDDWFVTADLAQLRGEASWVYPYCHEIGFWFAASVNAANSRGRVFTNGVPVAVNEAWEATDLYAFFYRRRFQERGGEGRFFAGFTGDGDGLFGSEFTVPLNNNFAIAGGYTYMLPADNNAAVNNQNEAWNVGINLVWSPGVCRNFSQGNYNKPLLNVADNGNFIVKRRLLP